MVKDILARHFAEYPAMGPQDAVKLLYQMEFGPEHMIRDEKKSLEMLRQEMAQLRPREGTEPLYEPIGNGLCRLNLRPCLQRGIPAEDIHRLFCQAAGSTQGDKRHFRELLGELEEMAEGDETPFEAIELDIFLIPYRDRNCPPLHHSEAYRAAYAPAYRLAPQKKVKEYLKKLREGSSPGPEAYR